MTEVVRGGTLTACEIVERIRARELTAEEVVTRCLERITARDVAVHAWTVVGGDSALAAARRLDRMPREAARRLPLLGVPVGIKDVFDTADLPTAYGSAIYREHQPAADAALVSLLRESGAIVVGKTKTAEFAFKQPPDTRNPVAPQRTPGGSSSGSAAAVSAGMVPIAIGTQTGGSIIRPASFCAVIGMKPTFGVLPLAGALPTASSLDTAGIFVRTGEDLRLVIAALTGNQKARGSVRCGRPLDLGEPPRPARVPRVGILRLGWDLLEPPARAAIEALGRTLAAVGVLGEEITLPTTLNELARAHSTIQEVETAAALGCELDRAPDAISEELRALITAGRAAGRTAYLRARKFADEQRWLCHEELKPFDGVLTASTLGPPPLGISATGDALLCRPWSLLGMPTTALPLAYTADGLPVGIQLVAGLHQDARLMATAQWLMTRVPS